VHDVRTVLAEAGAPDANRDGRGASARQPAWLRRLLALLAALVCRRLTGVRFQRAFARHGLPNGFVVEHPDLPPGSALAYADSIRGAWGNVIARMCCQRGIGPGHPGWPYLSRAILGFGGRLDLPVAYAALGCVSPPEWWESHWAFPAVFPAPPAPASRLLPQVAARASPPGVPLLPAAATRVAFRRAPVFAVAPRRTAGAATGPPGVCVETGGWRGVLTLADNVPCS